VIFVAFACPLELTFCYLLMNSGAWVFFCGPAQKDQQHCLWIGPLTKAALEVLDGPQSGGAQPGVAKA